MDGAESLVRTAIACGIKVCFANPGTTEMPLVAAIDKVDGIRPVLGLFEGVCSGAADGYARMTSRPAMTLLHLGPGFANSIANFHNARRARSPVLNVIGDHATWHAAFDAPLTSDILSLARPVSGWIRSVRSAERLAEDTAEAIAAAGTYPGRVATLIVPSNCQWDPAEGPAEPLTPQPLAPVSDEAVELAAEFLQSGARPALFLGGPALQGQALASVARIAAGTGCGLVCETFPARVERGPGRPAVVRLPYFPEQALEALSQFTSIVIVGARKPVAFFGYPDRSSSLIPTGVKVTRLAEPEQDVAGALEALASLMSAPLSPAATPYPERPPRPKGPINSATIGAAFAAVAPENCIVMEEGATSGFNFFVHTGGAPTHTYLSLTGGSIGQGLPCATGAAIASPDRKVICLQADGGGLYTLQALWTNARESLDVVTLICNNRRYRILQIELGRAGITEPGPKALSLTSLENPEIDWVKLAQGMGTPAVRVDDAEVLARELERALSEPGPHLIEMRIE